MSADSRIEDAPSWFFKVFVCHHAELPLRRPHRLLCDSHLDEIVGGADGQEDGEEDGVAQGQDDDGGQHLSNEHQKRHQFIDREDQNGREGVVVTLSRQMIKVRMVAGSVLSRTSTSLPKRLTMRPCGVVSKNDMGLRMMRFSIDWWNTCAAFSVPNDIDAVPM